MPRRLRNWMPDGIYHVTVRGNDRQRIFRDDTDFQQYVILMGQCRDELAYRLLAYALMPNHVHLVVQPLPGVPLSAVMQRLGSSYAQYFNHRHGRIGHLYQGRFYSNLVDRESYLLEVSRYVHLNPYRAFLCKRPSDYEWCSYQWYISNKPDPFRLVESGQVLDLFGANRRDQQTRYREYVEELIDQKEELAIWLERLHRTKIIPPQRWLKGV